MNTARNPKHGTESAKEGDTMKHCVNFICTRCESMFADKLRSCCYCGGKVISMELHKQMVAHNNRVVAMVEKAMRPDPAPEVG